MRWRRLRRCHWTYLEGNWRWEIGGNAFDKQLGIYRLHWMNKLWLRPNTNFFISSKIFIIEIGWSLYSTLKRKSNSMYTKNASKKTKWYKRSNYVRWEALKFLLKAYQQWKVVLHIKPKVLKCHRAEEILLLHKNLRLTHTHTNTNKLFA